MPSATTASTSRGRSSGRTGCRVATGRSTAHRPDSIVPAPTTAEIAANLQEELEHLERHVTAGDYTDPYEATYAILNGSRILYSLETQDVTISKREAGAWALKHLPDRWRPLLQAAIRNYDGEATPEDAQVLAAGMAPFVAMAREVMSRSA